MGENAMSESGIFKAAVKLPPERRAAYLDQACGSDEELRRDVDSLLRAHDEAGSFLHDLAAGTPATMDQGPLTEGPGTVIGSYKLLEQIGEGGFGVVFMAEQQRPIRRKVALKVIKPGMDTKQVVARFEAERQALALMDHPNIAHVFEGGETPGGRPFFVMELVKGVPITDFCDRQQRTVRERLGLFLDVCRAVQHAHQKGVIHRDIKPSNVLVTLHDDKAVVKVIDFGVAKATGQQLTEKTLYTGFAQLVGTPLYMSPEQAELSGLDVDTRSDIYSLGVLLYELLTGTTPFDSTRLKEVGYDEMRRIIREEEPPRPSTRLSTLGQAFTTISARRKTDPKRLSQLLRGELDWVVMKALEKDRNRRYESAGAFAADVERYLRDEPVSAGPPSTLYRLRRFVRRNRRALAVTASLFVAVIVVAAVVGWAAGDRVARRAATAVQVRDSLNSAVALTGENRFAAARRKLAEAGAQLGPERSALPDLAAEVEAAGAELDRFERFFDFIERAHAADAPGPEAALAADVAYRPAATLPATGTAKRHFEAQVPLLRQALLQYEVLGRDDWNAILEGGLLPRDQVESVRATVYEELLRLAAALLRLNEADRSRLKLSREAAVREALLCVEKAEGARPPTQAFYVLRGRCRQAFGDEAGAEADRQRADQTAPTIALDHMLRGQVFYDARMLPEAAQAFQAALRLDPANFWTLMWLGMSLCDLGQRPEHFAGAAGVFSGCILKRPDHAHAYVCRAIVYRKLRRDEEALADCSRAIELDPNNATAWSERGVVYCDHLAQYEKAIAYFSKAIELDPQGANFWFNRNVADQHTGEWATAAADCSRALELDSKRAEWWVTRGAIYCDHLAQYDKAVADFSKAIELDPKDAYAWGNRGNARRNLGQPDKALADWSRAIELSPRYAPWWGERGLAYAKLGQPGRGLADCSRTIQLAPKDARAWSNRGMIYCNYLAQYDKARADFSRAIELDPKYALAWSSRGAAHYLLGSWAKAVADCSKAIELDPKDAHGWRNRGSAWVKLGKLDQARADLSKAIELDPKDAKTWNYRGALYFELRQWHKALADYSKVIELEAKNTGAWTSRGTAYGKLGQWEKALADYSKAIELDPKLAPAWHNRGVIYRKQGQRGKAVADFSKAIDLDPKYVSAWCNRGAVYFNLGQWHKAVADCSKVIALDPKNAEAWHNRAAGYAKLGRWGQAVADLSKAIELEPTGADRWTNRGVGYRELGQPDKALADFSKAIELDPKAAQAWNYRAAIDFQLRQWDKALADSSKAIELDPKLADAWTGRGVAYSKLGRQDKAVADATKAIELDPKLAMAWTTRGVAYHKLGQPEKAVADLSKSLELDPKQVLVWVYRGVLYCDQLAQYHKAIADFSQAIELDPKLGSAWGNRGTAYLKLGRPDEAIADFSRAVELDPKLTSAWRGRGTAYGMLGQWSKAVADCSQAIALDPKDAADWSNRGSAYCRLGQPATGVADCSRAIDLNPKLADAWLNRGAAYDALGQLDKAIADWTKATELNPRLALAWINRGMAYQKRRQLQCAVADYAKAIEVDPKLALAWHNRGLAYSILGQWSRAVTDFSKVIELDAGAASAWNDRGLAYAKLGQPAKAVADFSKAIALDPKHAVAWSNRGGAYGILGQPAKAVADFSKAIELQPKHANAWYNRGEVYFALGQWDKAVLDFSKFIDLAPKDTSLVPVHLRRARANCRLAHFAQARADYESVLQRSPANAGVLNELAWLLATCPEPRARDPRRAVELGSKAIAAAPKAGLCWQTLGVARYRAGEWKGAVAALDRSVELRGGGDAVDHLFLAMAYRRLGDPDRARAAYDRAVQWLEKTKESLNKNKPQAETLNGFRGEAEEVLGLKKK
jgi:tetratricopeptide (TPR) repeat protein/serine/threonine protein kinase